MLTVSVLSVALRPAARPPGRGPASGGPDHSENSRGKSKLPLFEVGTFGSSRA